MSDPGSKRCTLEHRVYMVEQYFPTLEAPFDSGQKSRLAVKYIPARLFDTCHLSFAICKWLHYASSHASVQYWKHLMHRVAMALHKNYLLVPVHTMRFYHTVELHPNRTIFHIYYLQKTHRFGFSCNILRQDVLRILSHSLNFYPVKNLCSVNHCI